MIGDDDRLPTRDGTPSGKANERQMLDRGGMGTDGFRTDLRDNLDGTATMLRTRGGAPEFSTLPAKKKIAISVARGFVAYAPGNSYAALFDPYTLAIENKRFQLTSVTYHVSDVAETPYLPRKWFDVWSWDDADVRINGQIAKSFFPFRFPAVQKAIPFLVPWPTPPIYGDKYRNGNLPKRAFAVGPTAVGLVTDPMWAASDVPLAILTPKAPRTERKALVCGQAIDRQKIEATMAEFFFTGPSWDDINSGWGYSSLVARMTTSAPFLSSSASSSLVDMVRPSLANAGDSTGTMSTPITLPSTVVAVTAHGHMTRTPNFGISYGGKYVYDGTIFKEIPGAVDASYTRTTYACSSDATCTQDGEALTYAATNTKLFDVRQEITSCEASTITLATGGLLNHVGDVLMNTSNVLYWSSGYSPATVPPYRGVLSMSILHHEISNTYCSRNHDIQSGQFSVDHSSGRLVNVIFSKDHSYGPKAEYAPNTTFYDGYMGNQATGIWGMGLFGDIELLFDSECSYYKNPSGYPENMPQSAKDELNAAMLDMGNALFSQTMITDASQSGLDRTNFYYGSVNSSVDNLLASLSWETRDYILFDKTNDVLIYVKGEFSASKVDSAPALASLTVTLCVETPWGSASQTLYSLSYTYGNMLPENDTIDVGKTAIPSPQIRAIFIPKYREQGSFFGAAYITKAEVANGATPAVLVNFVLSLETYSFIGANETDGVVHFIPCNLIEMLYAFVFSRRYGCDPDERYPVDDAATFAAIMAGLFSVKRNIQFRDGQMVDWLVGLGLPYFGNLKTELYRV